MISAEVRWMPEECREAVKMAHGGLRRERTCGALAYIVASASLLSGLKGDAEPIVRGGNPPVADGALEESAAGAACRESAPLALYYDAPPTIPAEGDSIDFLFKVANRTGADLPLSSLAVRYYFTNEIAAPWDTSVY